MENQFDYHLLMPKNELNDTLLIDGSNQTTGTSVDDLTKAAPVYVNQMQFPNNPVIADDDSDYETDFAIFAATNRMRPQHLHCAQVDISFVDPTSTYLVRPGFIGLECKGICFELPRNLLASFSRRYEYQAVVGVPFGIPEIYIDHLEATTICDLFNYAINGVVPEMVYRDLLVAAEMFQIDDLKELCDQRLCWQLNLGNAYDMLRVSYELDATKLKQSAMNFIVRNQNYLQWSLVELMRKPIYWTKDLRNML